MIELKKLAVQPNHNQVQPYFEPYFEPRPEELNQTLRDKLAVVPIIYLRLSVQAIIVVLAVLAGLTTPQLVDILGNLIYTL